MLADETCERRLLDHDHTLVLTGREEVIYVVHLLARTMLGPFRRREHLLPHPIQEARHRQGEQALKGRSPPELDPRPQHAVQHARQVRPAEERQSLELAEGGCGQ